MYEKYAMKNGFYLQPTITEHSSVSESIKYKDRSSTKSISPPI